MLDAGIRGFINLREQYELDRDRQFDYQDTLMELADRLNIEIKYFHFPIRDMNVSSIETMKEILDTIDEMVAKRLPMYFHCWSGLGRTGIVAGCWLARHNDSNGDEILEMLEEIRMDQDFKVKYKSPQTDKQSAMVRNWRCGW